MWLLIQMNPVFVNETIPTELTDEIETVESFQSTIDVTG